MIHSHRFSTAAALTALALAAVCAAPAVHAAGSLRAAYVEEVIPSRTFTGEVFLRDGLGGQGTGPVTGIWGISSITITNQGSNGAQLNVFVGRNVGSDCSSVGPVNLSTRTVLPTVFVQPSSTMQLTFPTPLVVAPVNGLTCVSVFLLTGSTAGVSVQIHGPVN